MFDTQAFKQSVLNQAMQGKLTQQLPEDGNASELLKSIDDEKKRLINEGKIKKTKPLPDIDPEEIPFEIPENWQWVRLGNVTDLNIGKTPTRNYTKYWNGNIPWVAIKDINNGVLNKTNEYITTDASKDVFKGTIVPTGTMLMSFKLSIGKVCILGMPAYHNEAIVSFNFFQKDNITKMYLFNIVKELTDFAHTNSAVKGKTLNKKSLNNMLVPLPPLAEQQRIVSQIDKCFKLADSIDDEHELNRNFNTNMRISLLNAAMQGKLTKQLSEDGNASNLLNSIKDEKQRLIDEGKIKKQKSLPDIDPDEIPFDIPVNWQWARLGDVIDIIMGQSPKGKDVVDSNDNSNIEFHQGKTFFGDKVLKQSNKYTSNFSRVVNSDYIIMSVRAPVGDINMVNRKIALGRGLCGISPICINKVYLYYYLKTQKNDLIQKSTGSTFKAVNKATIFNIVVPLPPLSEQQRIVTKLNSLFSNLANLE